MAKSLQFCRVENPNLLLPVLDTRHPHSCFIRNQALTYKAFKDSLKFFTIGEEITEQTWIVTKNDRKRYENYISISAPTSITLDKESVPPEIRKVFADSTQVLNWDEGMTFVSLEKPVSRMILDISINDKGNVTEAHPCNLYYMELEDALKLKVEPPPTGEIHALSSKNQDEKFIASTWKYFMTGGEDLLRNDIDNNPSSGVFVDGKCVSGVILPAYGLISSLYTLREHRQKGYAKLTMNSMFLECAKQGIISALTVEKRNDRSIVFNEKLGVKLLSIVDWIDVKKLEVD